MATQPPPSHDRLVSDCFLYAWNYHPSTRRRLFHVRNQTPRLPGESLIGFKKRLSQQKGIGVVPGVFDLIWYRRGLMYAFDIKLEDDKLSDEQLAFGNAIEEEGGKWFEIRTFEDFKLIFDRILLL